MSGELFGPLTPDDIRALADAAHRTHSGFQADVEDVMTAERAAFVRRLRVDEGYTWRGVAAACAAEWDGDWQPPSNQLMGMALCEAAAAHFGETYMSEPWN